VSTFQRANALTRYATRSTQHAIRNTQYVIRIMQTSRINPKSKTKNPKSRGWFRKYLALPQEHGSWPLFLVPCFVGAAVAGEWNGPLWAFLVGSLALFMARQPLGLFVRTRFGRRKARDAHLALGWAVAYLLLASALLIPLLWNGRSGLLLLGVPAGALMTLYLVLLTRRKERAFWMQVLAVAGLSLGAPGAYYAATGRWEAIAGWLWVLVFLGGLEGVLSVEVRLQQREGVEPGQERFPLAWVAGYEVLMLAVIGLLAATGQVPGLTWAPFLLLALRTWWYMVHPAPDVRISHIGITQMGATIVFGLLLVGTFGLS